MKIPKDLQPLVKLLRAQGWTITPTRNNHLCFTSPNGQRYITASSPSDWRGRRNLIAHLRQLGASIPRNL